MSFKQRPRMICVENVNIADHAQLVQVMNLSLQRALAMPAFLFYLPTCDFPSFVDVHGAEAHLPPDTLQCWRCKNTS